MAELRDVIGDCRAIPIRGTTDAVFPLRFCLEPQRLLQFNLAFERPENLFEFTQPFSKLNDPVIGLMKESLYVLLF
jgi:hypothetical protein